jgi:hypothetical protein
MDYIFLPHHRATTKNLESIANSTQLEYNFGKLIISDNGKPGESQGRKATGLKLMP